MPNWCNNFAKISHPDPAVLQKLADGFNGEGMFNAVIPVPKELSESLGDDESQTALEKRHETNIAKHGYKDWYDYCVNEWGTKWDVSADGETFNIENDVFEIYFDSAWAPPTQAYDKMTAMGFHIEADYYEPGMAFCGHYSSDTGDDSYDLSDMSAREVREAIPQELDDMFGISEAIEEYEREDIGGLVTTFEEYANEQRKDNE